MPPRKDPCSESSISFLVALESSPNSSLWLGDDTALASLFLSTQTCWEMLSRNAATSCPRNSRSSEDRSFNCFQSTLKCPPPRPHAASGTKDTYLIAIALHLFYFLPTTCPSLKLQCSLCFFFFYYLDYDLSSPLEHKFHRTGTLSILNAQHQEPKWLLNICE